MATDTYRPDYYELCWRDVPTTLEDLGSVLAAWDLNVREDQAGGYAVRYSVPVYAGPTGEPVRRTYTRGEIDETARSLGTDPEAAAAQMIWRSFLRDIEPPDATPAPFGRR